MNYTLWIGLLLLGAALTGTVARYRGHDFWPWFAGGLLLLVVALPASFLVKDNRPRCPECAERVRPEARICPHCGSEITGRIVIAERKSPLPKFDRL